MHTKFFLCDIDCVNVAQKGSWCIYENRILIELLGTSFYFASYLASYYTRYMHFLLTSFQKLEELKCIHLYFTFASVW